MTIHDDEDNQFGGSPSYRGDTLNSDFPIANLVKLKLLESTLFSLIPFQYVVIIVAGTGILFTIIFHVGVKEYPRDCCAQFATRSSKRSAANWAAWFREPLFYQVHILLSPDLILLVLKLMVRSAWTEFIETVNPL